MKGFWNLDGIKERRGEELRAMTGEGSPRLVESNFKVKEAGFAEDSALDVLSGGLGVLEAGKTQFYAPHLQRLRYQ